MIQKAKGKEIKKLVALKEGFKSEGVSLPKRKVPDRAFNLIHSKAEI